MESKVIPAEIRILNYGGKKRAYWFMKSKVIQELRKLYPSAKIALRHANPLQLLVAVMLSAQCTDKMVNRITPALFAKYRTAKDFASADIRGLEGMVKSAGFYRTKAKHIKDACKIIVGKHGGKVPDTMEGLLELPGVARKTANIVLSNAYGKNEGIAVDTHVKRLAFRLGFTENSNPEKIEKDLMAAFPRSEWNKVTYLLIEHGRAICKAPVPLCSRCALAGICPKNGVSKSK
ncbi:MAG: endonuclease III [Candidatus Aenigmarchaeota archaeon]|nr:endonuclease III [Candidatus Aenigmarchaeota archaeon]